MPTLIKCDACHKIRLINGNPNRFKAYRWECEYSSKYSCSMKEDHKLVEGIQLCGPIEIDISTFTFIKQSG